MSDGKATKSYFLAVDSLTATALTKLPFVYRYLNVSV